jgi:hypothetical protein
MTDITADYVVESRDYGILASTAAGNVEVTLPAADGRRGQAFMIMKTTADVNEVQIAVNGGGTINGSALVTLTKAFDSVIVRADANGAYVIESEALLLFLQTQISGLESGKVDRAGDTMTGPLLIQPGGDTAIQLEGGTDMLAQAEPANPAVDRAIIWLSDGTGAGDAGDLMIKINIASVIKTGTIVDYSAL